MLFRSLGKGNVRYEMLRRVARQHRVPLAYCNLVGGNDELIFDGRSMVFNAAGELVAAVAFPLYVQLRSDLQRSSIMVP